MKKITLVLFFVQLFILATNAQCVYQNFLQEGFEYTTNIPGIIPGSLYHNTPQTHCPNTGSRAFYANFQNGFVGEFYNRSFSACANAPMRFSFWTKDCFASANNINIEILDANGFIISGPQNVINPVGGAWQQIVTPTFTSPTNTIIISMSTIAPGAAGNDMSLDDFSLEICVDTNLFNTTSDVFVCNLNPINLHDSLEPNNLSLMGIWNGPSILFNGNIGTFDQVNQLDGLYSYSLVGLNNCPDTLNYVNVTSSLIFDTIYETICSGDSYTLPNGNSVNTSGIYNDTLQTAQNCDSILAINLMVLAPITGTFTSSYCSNQTFTLSDGTILNSTGIYYDTLNSFQNCDSILTLNLTFNNLLASAVNASICNGEQYTLPGGQIVNLAGTYIDTIQNAAACDSAITTNLTVNVATSATVNTIICSNETYTLPDGQVVSVFGTYTDTIPNSNSCDSIITTNLSVNAISFGSLNDTICSNQNYTFPSGRIVSNAGNYSDTINNNASCDSIIAISLVVYSATFINTQASNLTVCLGEDALFYINATGTNLSYQWQENSGVGFQNIAGEINDSLNILNLTAASNNNLYHCVITSQCGVTNSSQALLSFADSLIVISESSDIVLCPDETAFSFEFGFVAQNVVNYQWQIDSSTGFQNLNNSGNVSGVNTNKLIVSVPYGNMNGAKFRVLYSDACGNSGISSEYLFQLRTPSPFTKSLDYNFCEEDDKLIEVNYDGTEFTWNDDNNTAGRFFIPSQTRDYVVSFRQNSSACIVKDTIFVSIEDCLANCIVTAPTAFSPNTDDVNDSFHAIATCELDFFEFIISNRWGEVVFTTNSFSEAWNGIYKNKPAPIGIYVWSAKYNVKNQNKTENTKGTFTLIR